MSAFNEVFLDTIRRLQSLVCGVCFDRLDLLPQLRGAVTSETASVLRLGQKIL